MRLRHTICCAALLATTALAAQDITSSSNYLNPLPKSDVTMPFLLTAEGQQFTPTWGLDQAWISTQNMRKGINHMGKENVGIGRSCFRMTDSLTNDSVLSSSQVSYLRTRNGNLNLASNTLPLVLTADQEAGSHSYYFNGSSANATRWAAMINSHVAWLKANTKHPVIGVSPFNEPDYWSKEEGATTTIQSRVAQLLREQHASVMADVNIVGGNTLNDDKALEWYNVGRQYYEWGNTHQLAGSFDNFANFFKRLQTDGKVGYADEMHNVGEAMIGLEYGMTVGIWWGFDSRARGEFCDISRNGRRLAYAEHRNNWTAASVYRHNETGAVKAFIGSSERQAYTTTYQLLSTDRPVYYDGYGPYHEYRMEMPGGTGYQKGQTNAERVIDITWGDDVPPAPIDGTYIIMNRATLSVASEYGTAGGHTNISQSKYTGAKTQQWNIHPCDPRCGGDYSFYDITSVSDDKRMDVLDFSTVTNANVIAYANTNPSSNEQWYLEYAGDGFYYIRNRESALYLTLQSSGTANGVNIRQQSRLSANNNPALQQWRILPVDAACELEAPAPPTRLAAQAETSSVLLTWDANSEPDLEGYMVLRSPRGADEWNTIARKVATTSFLDNTCQQGTDYEYRVKAIDHSDNQSLPSLSVTARPSGFKDLIARYEMEDNVLDQSHNLMDAATYPQTPTFTSNAKSGSKALLLNGSTTFLQLPYEIANTDELTVSMWVYWRSSSNWQRIFDFGNGTDQYMFLTPSNGSVMRFAIKNRGDEQIVDCPKLPTTTWKHVAVAIGRDSTTVFIDGKVARTSKSITIRPSDIHPLLNYIGRSQFPADPLFSGYIDDLRIYNFALTADQIENSMNNIPEAIRTAAPPATGGGDRSVYDLQGRRVSAQNASSQLPDGNSRQLKPGIYVVGGKKYVIK